MKIALMLTMMLFGGQVIFAQTNSIAEPEKPKDSLNICHYGYNLFVPKNGKVYNALDDSICYDSFGIYDRWGEIMFKSKDGHSGWDGYHNGKLVSEGNYYYVISFDAMKDGDLAKKTIYGAVLVLYRH